MPKRAYKLIEVLDGRMRERPLGAEIGVQFGKTSIALLNAFPTLTLYLVDSYDDRVFGHRSGITAAGAKEHAQKRLARHAKWCCWLTMTSVEAAKYVSDGTLDFVFIDATHTYEAVAEDIGAWLPKIRAGGTMAGHDFRRYRGVKRAVKEHFPNVQYGQGDMWWVYL